jgi:PmbA protein
VEDPNMHGSIYNALVDYSGIPIEKKNIIDNGIVNSFLLNLEYGQKLQMQPTGNSWYGAIGYTNIYAKPGSFTYEELVKNMNTGIIVKSILGSGFDEETGEISVSIKGFYIENGEFKGTVNGTINGNILKIMKNVELANDMIFDQEMNCPSIELEPMKFAPSSSDKE